MRSSLADPVALLADALSETAGAAVTLERPPEAAQGDYATNVAMRPAGQRRQPRRGVAAELADAAAALAGVERAEVAGPGFVNVFLGDTWFVDALESILATGDGFAGGSAESPERVQVELVSANPTGPLTVASARN